MKLAGLFEKAFADAGVELPRGPDTPKALKAKPSRKVQPSSVKRKPASAEADKAPAPTRKQHASKVRPKPALSKPKPRNSTSKHRDAPPPEIDSTARRTVTSGGVLVTRRKAVAEKSRHTPKAKPIPTVTQAKDTVCRYRITAQPEARVTWRTYTADQDSALLEFPLSGRETALTEGGAEKELYLGLDFGTSTIKAVIRDKERRRSYAVPFRNMPGVYGYLLPCRVFLYKQGFNLEGHGKPYQDLKLAFLAAPDSIEAQQPVIAFIALVLRRVRAWLLHEHRDTYNNSWLLWEVCMGLPIAHSSDEQAKQAFRLLGMAAWIASTQLDVTPETITQAIARAQELDSGAAPAGSGEDFGLEVEPEAAAQIYGYVSSSDFDPGALNYYLMVDIGAGTLDASLFYVRRAKAGSKVDLSVFRTTVEPLGVMNLHAKRINWLLAAVEKKLPERDDLRKDLEHIRAVTDAVAALPDKIDGYFDGLRISFQSPGPDEELYRKVQKQVASDTYVQVAKEKRIDQQHLTDIPMYLCGGGSRSPLYRKLQADMRSTPNASWFGAKARVLQKPHTLVAPGLAAADYDRLSVAYGLSQIKMGNVVYEVPPLDAPSKTDYTDRYTDKSLV